MPSSVVIFRKHQRGGTIKVSSLVIFMLASPDFYSEWGTRVSMLSKIRLVCILIVLLDGNPCRGRVRIIAWFRLLSDNLRKGEGYPARSARTRGVRPWHRDFARRFSACVYAAARSRTDGAFWRQPDRAARGVADADIEGID